MQLRHIIILKRVYGSIIMRANGGTAAKCSLERRDFLTLLLAAPARMLPENDEITTDCQHDHMVRRLAAHLNDGKVHLFPAYELESILRALAEECNRPSDPPRIRSIDQPPHKRPRMRQVNNNLHSILRFVERVTRQRYERSPKCHNTEDDELLDDELKLYFGARDLSFQIEEDILCLAFEIALDALVQCVEDEGPNARTSTDDGNKSDMEVPPARSIIGSHLTSDGVIETALRIIDSTVLIDRRMRAKLGRLQQAQRRGQISFDAKITDRSKKYEHLLKPKTRRHDNGQNSANHPATHVGVISIMEENYSQQWEWLRRMRTNLEEKKSSLMPTAASASVNVDFVIVRRRIEALDDISLSSNDSHDEMNDESDRSITTTRELYPGDLSKPDTKESNPIPEQGSELAPHAASNEPTPDTVEPVVSPFERLDLETHQLRLALLDLSPGESSSAEVVRHTVGEVASLLGRYGDLDGAAGIARCGDVLGGVLAVDAGRSAKAEGGGNPKRAAAIVDDRFPLNDAVVSSLATAFLTDATGALRARAFLRSFVLPLMVEMNPKVRAMSAAGGGPAAVPDGKAANDDRGGKPASRALMSLLSSLSRERPMECVVSVIVPSLVIAKPIPPSSSMTIASPSSFEPTRFQCELISRVLRGRDALSVPAIALLVREVLPPSTTTTTKEGGGIVGADGIASPSSPLGSGMKWTESTMPLLTACLNSRPTLPDDVVAALADEISHRLSSLSKNDGTSSTASSTSTMTKSIQFSTLFHALVTRYGTQLKSTRRVETLSDSALRLGTFMSKSICLALRKLS